MKTQEFDNNSPCPLEEVIILLRLARSMAGFWCAPSASWDTAALPRLLWVPGNSSSLPIPWEAWLCVCSPQQPMIFSQSWWVLAAYPRIYLFRFSQGGEQYSHFPSCPAVRARKRGNSPFYCPITPSKRYIPRKTVLFLEKISCQQTNPETSCCKTTTKNSLIFVLLK